MKLLHKKELVVSDEIMKGYLIHIFKKCLLGEVVPSLLNFILAFFVLFIGNNLFELIQGNHANGLIAKKVVNQ
jgi:hypothetical protein